MRRYDRAPFRGPVTLTWTGPDGNGQFTRGTGVDISRSGFSIAVPIPFQPQAYVSFQSGDGRLSGTGSVRYCFRKGTGFLLGIEFSGGLEWNPGAKAKQEA